MFSNGKAIPWVDAPPYAEMYEMFGFPKSQVDVAYFPFDDQKCLLKLGSWLHDGFSVSNTHILSTSI